MNKVKQKHCLALDYLEGFFFFFCSQLNRAVLCVVQKSMLEGRAL